MMMYSKLVSLYEDMQSTPKRLLKTYYLSEFLKKVEIEDLDNLINLIRGKVFSEQDKEKLGVSSKLIVKAISISTGMSLREVEDEWRRTGDLGLVAENLVGKKKQVTLFSTKLSVKKVFDNLRRLPLVEGLGSVEKKLNLIAELLTSAKPLEAKYIVRTVLEEMRVGVGDGSIRDAFVWAWFDKEIGLTYDKEANNIVFDEDKRDVYNEYVALVERAYNMLNEFREVAKLCKQGKKALGRVGIKINKPLKVMLAQKVEGIDEGFKKVGRPARIEYKYDGFRMQIHKVGDKVTLFTRRLENVTTQFPEIIDYVKKNVSGKEFIIDGEAVGFDKKTGEYMPFQKISQRIRRKYDIKKLSEKLPVELNVFDILYYQGKSLIEEPLENRLEKLRKILKETPKKIILAKGIITEDDKTAEKFYKDSLNAGEEGVIMKRLDGPYKPGNRVGGWVKIKPVMESLDVVVTGAEWGEGKRSSWLTSFKIGIIDEAGELLEIGKVGTGIKELESEGAVTFERMTELLKPLIIEEHGKEVIVRAEVVIEVNYEEIQKSTNYSSGFALRFPRVARLREDRGVDDASTIFMVEEFFKKQKR